MTSTDGVFNFTQPVVMSFPHLFEAVAFKKNGRETGEAKYSANFNFPADSEDLKTLKTLAARVARAKWPDKPFSEIAFPFTSGDKLADDRKQKGKSDGEYTRGKVVMVSRSKYEPRLAYVEKGKIVDCESDMAKQAAKNKFYSGAEVLAQINFQAYDGVGSNKDGVTAYLGMVLTTGKGTRLSGGQTASEAFRGYAGAVSAEDPTAPGHGVDMDDILM